MVVPRTEKAYEKYAWILLFSIGTLSLILGIGLLFGIDPSTSTEEKVIGTTLGQLKASNPKFFDFVTLYERLGGLFYLAIALPSMIISSTAYRRGEKWAWYAMWGLPVVFTGLFAIYFTVEPFGPPAWLAASLVGLLLSYRSFFPKKT